MVDLLWREHFPIKSSHAYAGCKSCCRPRGPKEVLTYMTTNCRGKAFRWNGRKGCVLLSSWVLILLLRCGWLDAVGLMIIPVHFSGRPMTADTSEYLVIISTLEGAG